MNARLVLLLLLAVPGIAICAKWEVPSNVTTRMDGRNQYMDAVDFSYDAGKATDFAELKMCVAETVTNNAVHLSDNSRAFIGPATGTYYQGGNSQTMQGGAIFKYVGDASSALIATGTADGGATALGFTRDIVRYDLKVAVSGSQITLRFTNITRAQQDTGSAVNDGFDPVGMWKGAGAQRIYASLASIATRFKACAN